MTKLFGKSPSKSTWWGGLKKQELDKPRLLG
jgi:hypothetical protein